MSKEQIVLVLPGSFNPPTNGHLFSATLARDHMMNLGFDVVDTLLIPAHGGYKKPELLPGAARAEMCKAMADQTTFLKVETCEVEKDHWSRTIDTLLYLKDKYGGKRVMIVCGIDLVETFEKSWRENDVKRILEEFGLCVLRRVGEPEVIDLKSKCKYIEGREANIYFIDDNPLERVSSTLVRNRIKEGKNINGLVDPNVIKIIQENEYYK